MSKRPPFADQWDGLLAVARELQRQRAAGDAAHVEKGTLSAADAGDRARLANAHVRMWQAIVARTAMPELGAGTAELRADLAAALDRARIRAGRRPDDRAAQDFAAGIRAMLWHLAPPDGSADILMLHGLNLELRARVSRHRSAA